MELSRYYDAQAAVIGSMLIDPEALVGQTVQALRAEEFRDAALRTIYRAACELYLEAKPVDAVTVCAAAGSEYRDLIAQIMRATPTAANWGEYVAIVKAEALLGRLKDVAMRLTSAPTAEEARALVTEAAEIVAARPNMRATPLNQLLSDFISRMDDRTPVRYLDWALKPLNRFLRVKAGHLVMLGGDSSSGKTALALQLAFSFAKQGLRVGFVSIETPEDDLTDRIVAEQVGVRLKDIKDKKLRTYDLKQVAALGELSNDLCLDVIPAYDCTVADIRAMILAKHYDVVFIDYVQILSSGADDERVAAVTRVSMQLRALTMALPVTVIGLSQVTPKDKTTHVATKEELRESRQLLQDANVIMTMSLVDRERRDGPRIVLVDKNKDGPCGQFQIEFDAEHLRFYTGDKATPGQVAGQVVLKELPGDEKDLPF